MSNISIIESAVTSLDSLLVYPIPSKAIKNVTAIRIDRTVVLIDGKGRLYSTQVQGRFSFGAGENRESIRNTITGAARLGAISKAAMEEDLRFRQAADLEREMQYAAFQILAGAKQLGIEFTEAQRRRIDSAQPKKKAA